MVLTVFLFWLHISLYFPLFFYQPNFLTSHASSFSYYLSLSKNLLFTFLSNPNFSKSEHKAKGIGEMPKGKMWYLRCRRRFFEFFFAWNL